jgi:hypothetical protein
VGIERGFLYGIWCNMGLKTETRTIDELEVSVTQLPAMRSLALLPRLSKLALPAFMKADDPAFMKADVIILVGELLAGLEPAEAQALVRDLNAGTTVQQDGKLKPLTSDQLIDSVFNGKVMTLLKVTMFAVEVNFADFFGGKNTAPPGTESTD